MSQLQTGNLLIRAQEDDLVFELAGQLGHSAEVRLEDIGTIVEFLNTHTSRHADRRVGFRLDLRKIESSLIEGLHFCVQTSESSVELRPIDLSLSGFCGEASVYLGEFGTTIDMTITFGSCSVSLPAKIVRGGQPDRATAVHFTGVVTAEGELKPPHELRRIFNALESLWLDQSLGLKWSAA